MGRKLLFVILAVAVVISFAVLGCKAKVEKAESEIQQGIDPETVSTVTTEEMVAVTEPFQSV